MSNPINGEAKLQGFPLGFDFTVENRDSPCCGHMLGLRLVATSRSAIGRLVIPAIPPIADVDEASVRFPELRRLYPQVRATGRGVP